MQFDAVTVAPYMGADSVEPFLAFKDKWTILLACTSNPGSNDFQMIESKATGRPLYEEVIIKALEWAGPDQLMFVAGATAPERIKRVRSLAPDHFLLVPGIGAQGGSLSAVSEAGMNKTCGLLVNATRSILYASNGKDFADEAAKEARCLRDEMSSYLERFL
jgi:orotidine-5'-phosphate decarboxylase